MVHLEGGDAVIHCIEVFLDEQQTVVDEACSAVCHLVLLGQPSFIEGLQDDAEHLFGAAGRIVDILEVDDGALLIVLRDGEPAAYGIGLAKGASGIGGWVQAVGHIGEEGQRGVLAQDIGHAGGLLHQGHVVEVGPVLLLGNHGTRGLHLHEHGGFACVHVGGGHQIIGGH